MSAKETRKWAAKWLGNGYTAQLNGTYVTHADAGATYEMSDTDLAEAVRVKLGAPDHMEAGASMYYLGVGVLHRLSTAWLTRGPLAFIQAVREWWSERQPERMPRQEGVMTEIRKLEPLPIEREDCCVELDDLRKRIVELTEQLRLQMISEAESNDRIAELEAALIQLQKDSLPDPFDERDIDLGWLRERIWKAAHKTLEKKL